MASGLRSHFQSFLFFWPGRRPPVALDVLKMKSVKWWKLKNNEIIKSCPRSYLRVCLLAHVAMLKWRHWGWILGGWFGGPPCTSGWLFGWVSGHGNLYEQTNIHPHTARDRMSCFNPAIYFVPQCSFMFNVLSFCVWLEAAFVFLISCCFRFCFCSELYVLPSIELMLCQRMPALLYLIIAFWGFWQVCWQVFSKKQTNLR